MFTFIMDYEGHFRLQAPDGTQGPVTMYEHIATVEYNGDTYMAVTSNYDGVLKPEQVYKLSPVSTTHLEVPAFERPILSK